ncbi:hypothetical protein PPROV_000294900 [Pycnococcus provasolii]|uniref:J domain-containing protein n=1 Tax=Pycnococcus provasolii TaxID=41880 RepID=A0A830HB27_9CHLO|nr:hypothetical protein PPROV_000294900 [Pycnococcus provasolii]
MAPYTDDERNNALQSLLVAQRALQSGDSAKAQRFYEKAARLAPRLPEVLAFERLLSSAGPGASPKTGPSPSSSSTSYTSSQQQPRQRHTASSSGASSAPKKEEGTPEQVALVRKINAAKDYYDTLSVDKSALEDDIKRAYKKLALKLHPDKNKANGAEDAFKKVSKAVACLTDEQSRASYDRYGHEDGPAAAAAARGGGGMHGGGFRRAPGGGFEAELSPEDIFNMMFGGGFPGGFAAAGGPGFRTYHFRTGGGGGQRRQQQQQAQQAPPINMNLIYLFLMATVFLLQLFGQSSPPYSFSNEPRHGYTVEQKTTRSNVPYYTREKYDVQYPARSTARYQMESRIEGEFREHLVTQCHYERVQRERMRRFGSRQQRDFAAQMELENCNKMEQYFPQNQYRHRHQSATW